MATAMNETAPREPRILLLGEGCCGCSACSASCPVGCISMERDSLGFLRPAVDASSCLECGRCERACPAISRPHEREVCRAYWCQAKDHALLGRSSSGGVFGLLASATLDGGGVVYGAAFDDGFRTVSHRRASSREGLEALLESKYVQGAVGREVYEAVSADLGAGRRVLYSGTGCQVAGLRGYLGRAASSELLLTVEVICHGAPSPRLWSDYVGYLEDAGGSEVTEVNFRSKSSGWTTFSFLHKCRKEKVSEVPHSRDWYMRAFLRNASLRGSCHECPVRAGSGADITLGDFWGFARQPEGVDVSRGVSAVLANSPQALRALAEIDDLSLHGECSLDEIAAHNSALVKSVAPHERATEFKADVASGVPVNELRKRWPFEDGLAARARRKATGLLRKLVGR